jgi:hypothetical protein
MRLLPFPAAVDEVRLTLKRQVTFSLPSSCSKVDAGRWSKSQTYEGPLRSARNNAVAALYCCTMARTWAVTAHVDDEGASRSNRQVPGCGADMVSLPSSHLTKKGGAMPTL